MGGACSVLASLGDIEHRNGCGLGHHLPQALRRTARTTPSARHQERGATRARAAAGVGVVVAVPSEDEYPECFLHRPSAEAARQSARPAASAEAARCSTAGCVAEASSSPSSMKSPNQSA
eukprot:CAMPEP_0177347520 /NCGR_PEP_ID=MMETSP0368-20130122/29769_1 /TAXON_ID=447022 ORGANISM="Scrippsiella hangoei-like, Strain SHHI-4" /NCGR_SAMPLE_ID=MMETSP0368 /ASSEMBLY_ACC=CAM_ASM_000363 /LENGTH=119 /DNA_ID=CAMNT_0018809257 /DNA_START=213 /DNA_END=570 /DNA_ORIENTATION=+